MPSDDLWVQLLPIAIWGMLALPAAITLLRRVGMHRAWALFAAFPIIGLVALVWIIAYSRWPLTGALRLDAPSSPNPADDSLSPTESWFAPVLNRSSATHSGQTRKLAGCQCLVRSTPQSGLGCSLREGSEKCQ